MTACSCSEGSNNEPFRLTGPGYGAPWPRPRRQAAGYVTSPGAPAPGEPDATSGVSAQALTSPAERPMPLGFESRAGCLDGAATNLSGFLVPATCNGASPSQQWRVHPWGELQNVASGLCLGRSMREFLEDGSIFRGQVVFTDVCQSGPEWTWRPSPAGELRSRKDCLATQQPKSSVVTMARCDGSLAQSWKPRFRPPASLEEQFWRM
jgi:hypothetical protein